MLSNLQKWLGTPNTGTLRRRPRRAGSGSLWQHRLALEPLEPRRVLGAGPLLISELLAVNDHVLADQDGDSSDWIEIHNPSHDAVSLDGWYLTDDAEDLSQWQFPAVSLEPGAYLLVFASNKDRSVAGAELHTNFKLDGDGEYLALVQADGATVAHEFAPQYPEQLDDVSYGLADATTAWDTLVGSQAPVPEASFRSGMPNSRTAGRPRSAQRRAVSAASSGETWSWPGIESIGRRM